jgi:outer membrane protein
LLGAMAMLAGTGALAQGAIAYVDLERVMVDSAAGKRFKAELDREIAGYSRDLDTIGERAKAISEEVKKNAVVMTDEDRRARERELQSLQGQFDRKKAQYQEEFEAHRREAIESVHRQIMAIVARVAAQRNLDIVVNRLVWRSDAIDLTEEVLKALDAATPAG